MRRSLQSTQTPDSYEMSAALYQHTDEVSAIPNAKLNEKGYIEVLGIVLPDMVIFPKMVSPIFLASGKNLLAIESAQQGNQSIIVLTPKNKHNTPQKTEDFLEIGVESVVGQLIKLSGNNHSALIQGRRRIEIINIIKSGTHLKVIGLPVNEVIKVERDAKALIRTTKKLFGECVQLDRSLPDEAGILSMSIDEPDWLSDFITTAIPFDWKTKTKLLCLKNPLERLSYLNSALVQELDMLELEDTIQSRVQQEMDKNQREFYLREQVKAIQAELGEGDIWERELNTYREKIKSVDLSKEVRIIAIKELDKLTAGLSFSPETGIIRNYLDWILDLPWQKYTTDNLSVRHASRILEKNHYGLKKAKERILEYLAVRSLNAKTSRQPILCFIGPPGTGKTSLGKSIAEALGRKFARVSLGGIHDEAEIRGHRRTYIGALPGRIIQTIKRAGSINPLFMLDEVDKLGNDFRGDPAAALLEVLDPEQNHSFSDHFLEFPFNLSDVMFITTANSTENIPAALLDRMEVVEFPGYIEEEKIQIAKKFLIPKQMLENGLSVDDFKIEPKALVKIIQQYTFEPGVRNLEREIGKICRKISRKKSEGKPLPALITENSLNTYLGPSQYLIFEAEHEDEIGVATAVAWTENGGEIMPVEVLYFKGKGNLQITGQVGDIMQESAQAALSYLKSKASQFKVNKDIFEKIDIHIHIPEGAIPKDGPSAGITIATALISAFTKRKVYKEIGMLGEMTLRGKILQVGGVREKVLAAHRAGLKKVILPKDNLKDLVDIPSKALKELLVIPVDHMDQVLKVALHND